MKQRASLAVALGLLSWANTGFADTLKGATYADGTPVETWVDKTGDERWREPEIVGAVVAPMAGFARLNCEGSIRVDAPDTPAISAGQTTTLGGELLLKNIAYELKYGAANGSHRDLDVVQNSVKTNTVQVYLDNAELRVSDPGSPDVRHPRIYGEKVRMDIRNSTIDSYTASQIAYIRGGKPSTLTDVTVEARDKEAPAAVCADRAEVSLRNVVVENGGVLRAGSETATANPGKLHLLGVTMQPKAGAQYAGTLLAKNGGLVTVESNTRLGGADQDVRLVAEGTSGSSTPSKISLEDGVVFSHDFSGIIAADGCKLALGGGNLVTSSGLIFAQGSAKNVSPSDAARLLAANSVAADIAGKLAFSSGALTLDDRHYTADYAKSARAALNDPTVKGNNVRLTMLGAPVDSSGATIADPRLPAADLAGMDLHQVAGTTDNAACDGNLAVGSPKDTPLANDAQAQNVANALGVKYLDLGQGDTVTVTVRSTPLSLYSGDKANGNELIVSGKGAEKVKVYVGGSVAKAKGTPYGALNLGYGVCEGYAEYGGKISGAVDVQNRGALSVLGGDYHIGALKVHDPDTSGGDGEGARVVVDTRDGRAARLSVASLSLSADSRFLVGGDGSMAAVKLEDTVAGTANTLAGTVGVMRGSVLAFGTDDLDTVSDALAASEVDWRNRHLAVCYVHEPLALTGTALLSVGGVLADCTWKKDDNGKNDYASRLYKDYGTSASRLGPDSLLVVNGASASLSRVTTLDDRDMTNKAAAISGGAGAGQITVDPAATLAVVDATLERGQEKTYKIFSDGLVDRMYGAGQVAVTGLTKCRAVDDTFNTVTLYRSPLNPSETVIPGITGEMENDPDPQNPGEGYITDITDGKTPGEATEVVDTAAQLAQTVGVTAMTIDAALDVADTIKNRLSLTDDVDWRDREDTFWVRYLHSKKRFDGMALAGSASGDHDTSYNGFVLGYDTRHTGALRSGFAVAHGEGTSTSRLTRDDFDFNAVSLYGNRLHGSLNLMWDVGYVQTGHDVKGLGLSASPEVDLFTAGAVLEKRFESGSVDLTPHFGLRYMNVNSGSYSAKYRGGTAMRYDVGRKSLVFMPLGVNLGHTATAKGVKWRTALDLTYLANLGGRSAHVDTMNVSVPGIAATDSFGYELTERGSFVGSLSVTAAAKNWSIGIGYSRQQSNVSHSDRVYIKGTVSF